MRPSLKTGFAFSLVEVAITTAVVGILASLALVGIGKIVQSSKNEKLHSDVETLNRGVIAYRASGGDLSDLEDPNQVLNALKQTSSINAPGLTGAKLDPRVTFVYQTNEEATSGNARVYWDPSSQRFKISNSGSAPGIKGFEFSAEAGDKDYGASDPDYSMLYAEEDNWIWDYQEIAPATPAGPSQFAVTPVPNSSTPPIPSSSLPPVSPPAANQLDPPVFSIPSSSFPYPSFDLSLFLSDPNPPGVSEIYYSIDYGNWVPYTGSVTVPPDANVAAQAVALNSSYSNSPRVDHAYGAIPVPLLPPVINPSRTLLGLFSERVSDVTIVNPNDPSISEVEYQLNGGDWFPYTGTFRINRNNFPTGVTILSRAVPSSNPYYTASNSTSSQIDAEGVLITGDAVGTFHNPLGESELISNISSETTSNYFEWGKATPSASSLTYNNSTFNTLSIVDSFKVGDLDYFNGTILTGTGADSISLTVDLDLNVNGLVAMSTFEFDFGLINVENKNDPKNPWADADYVQLAQPVANETIIINGVEFKLKLEFGETSASGIAQFDEFHVLENQSARTALYGTLVEVGSFDVIEYEAPSIIESVVDTIDDTVSLIGGTP